MGHIPGCGNRCPVTLAGFWRPGFSPLLPVFPGLLLQPFLWTSTAFPLPVFPTYPIYFYESQSPFLNLQPKTGSHLLMIPFLELTWRKSLCSNRPTSPHRQWGPGPGFLVSDAIIVLCLFGRVTYLLWASLISGGVSLDNLKMLPSLMPCGLWGFFAVQSTEMGYPPQPCFLPWFQPHTLASPHPDSLPY